jgi:ABC-type multidrug transport system fused ATPase/permease subunit
MTLAFMAALNWRLALTTFVVVPAIVLLSRAMGSFTSRMAKASQVSPKIDG